MRSSYWIVGRIGHPEFAAGFEHTRLGGHEWFHHINTSGESVLRFYNRESAELFSDHINGSFGYTAGVVREIVLETYEPKLYIVQKSMYGLNNWEDTVWTDKRINDKQPTNKPHSTVPVPYEEAVVALTAARHSTFAHELSIAYRVVPVQS